MAGRAACIGKTPSRARSFSIKRVKSSLRRRHTRGHCRRERTRHVPYTQSQTALKLHFVHFVMTALAPSLRNGQSGVKAGTANVRSSANLDVINASVLPLVTSGLHADLGAVGDEDAVEGSGLPGMIIYIRCRRADHGAGNAKGEGPLTIIFVMVTDNNVVCSWGAGVVGPNVTERVRGRAGAVFALEVVGFV